MKSILTWVTLFFTSSVMAHDDHYLNATFHEFYHVAFYALGAVVVFKAAKWALKRWRTGNLQ